MSADYNPPIDYVKAMEHLVSVVRELSLARDLDTIMSVVRLAARELTGADGATFVLRDGNNCFYAEENAISPLWKGKRFPMEICISGWVMLNRRPATIPNIYEDPRIPADAYRPTFVKSLVMVPIRTSEPIGAIGNYWAHTHQPAPEIVRILSALADTTSVAMENVQLYSDLEQRVRDRTAQLEAANRELEAFSYTVSHDLRAPLRSIDGFSSRIADRYADGLDDTARDYLDRVRKAAARMRQTIDDLLTLSRTTRADLQREQVDLASLAREAAVELKDIGLNPRVQFSVPDHLPASCDPGLMQVVVQNLLANAWKYTLKTPTPRVEFGTVEDRRGKVFRVRDNGVGFDPGDAQHLFQPFKRLHSSSEFPGTGIGLATVHRIIMKHGGRIWAESAPNAGTSFYFTLEGQDADEPKSARM